MHRKFSLVANSLSKLCRMASLQVVLQLFLEYLQFFSNSATSFFISHSFPVLFSL